MMIPPNHVFPILSDDGRQRYRFGDDRIAEGRARPRAPRQRRRQRHLVTCVTSVLSGMTGAFVMWFLLTVAGTV